MKTIVALASLMMAAGFASFAQADDIALGQPAYGGTGCPAGSVDATLSPDQKSLSVLFDSYQVEAGGDTNKTFDRKSCNIGIPVHVPQGLSISVLAIDYRGYNNVPVGGNTNFNVEYFFAGTRGPVFNKTFYGPLDSDYTIHNQLTAQSMIWSACGADVILRTNSGIRITTKNNKQALATVNSEDVSAALVYQLQWRKC